VCVCVCVFARARVCLAMQVGAFVAAQWRESRRVTLTSYVVLPSHTDSCDQVDCANGPFGMCRVAATCSDAQCQLGQAKADGLLCSDGNGQSYNDQCRAGECIGELCTCWFCAPASCLTDSILAAHKRRCPCVRLCTPSPAACVGSHTTCSVSPCHRSGTCVGGTCLGASQFPDGAACVDPDTDTSGTCLSGVCVATGAGTCAVDGAACSLPLCQSAGVCSGGRCVGIPEPDGADCSSGAGTKACSGGACVVLGMCTLQRNSTMPCCGGGGGGGACGTCGWWCLCW